MDVEYVDTQKQPNIYILSLSGDKKFQLSDKNVTDFIYYCWHRKLNKFWADKRGL